MLMDYLCAAAGLVAAVFLTVVAITVAIGVCALLYGIWGNIFLPFVAKRCRWRWIQVLCEKINGFSFDHTR